MLHSLAGSPNKLEDTTVSVIQWGTLEANISFGRELSLAGPLSNETKHFAIHFIEVNCSLISGFQSTSLHTSVMM